MRLPTAGRKIVRVIRCVMLLGAVTAGWSLPRAEAQESSIRGQAVVNLTFDEESGDALDTATAGAAKDVGQLKENAVRRRSPFWNQAGKKAVILDQNLRQSIQIPDSADLDRPEAVTVSLLYANLNAANDPAFHGLFGKRQDGTPLITNYGINYQGSGDNFQVYVADTTGYRVVNYKVSQTIGSRKPVYLSAVFEIGDAPGADADSDKDDVRIALFINGKAVTPVAAPNGQIAGTDGWLHDVQVAKLLNDQPLCLGSSMATAEYGSCWVDEFSLFSKALTAEEANKLFLEVAGANVQELLTKSPAVLPPQPEITLLSQQGLQAGVSTRLTVFGSSLGADSQIWLPVPIEKQTVTASPNGQQLTVDLTLPANTPPGHYPVRVQTGAGVSLPLPLAIDALPHFVAGSSSAEKPISLPAAVTGLLSGDQQPRVYFQGKKGERFVADIECRRLGAQTDPVLELRNARNTPLLIEWGRPQSAGDAHIEFTLPADGLYLLDLHDLTYRAPGNSPYRLKLGTYRSGEHALPTSVTRGQDAAIRLLSPFSEDLVVPVSARTALPGQRLGLVPPADQKLVGPLARIVVTDAQEIVEAAATPAQPQTVDLRFAERQHLPVGISGRITQPGEADSYLIQVKPGQTLNFSIESRGLNSPLDGRINLQSHPQNALLASSDERGSLDYAVPAGTELLKLVIDDLEGRGGADFLYRVRVIPAGQPNFSLSLSSSRALLARDGATVLTLDVNRQGYNGPIDLQLLESEAAPVPASRVQVIPNRIPEGATKAFITLAPLGDASNWPAWQRLFLIGRSTGLEPALERLAALPADPKAALPAIGLQDLALVTQPAVGVKLLVPQLPSLAFKGASIKIPVTVERPAGAAENLVARFKLVTTEQTRLANPQNPAQGNKPLISSLPEQSLLPGESQGQVEITVPLDVAEPVVDGVLRLDLLPDLFSDTVVSSLVSAPFRLSVQNAIAVKPVQPLQLTGESKTTFLVTMDRTAGFTEPVLFELLNLPQGYTAAKVRQVGDQQKEIATGIEIMAPKVAAAADLPNILLRITTESGSQLVNDIPVPTKAVPKP